MAEIWFNPDKRFSSQPIKRDITLTVFRENGENLLSSFFSFTFKPKILQSSISSQLTTWFRYDSQKTSMPPFGFKFIQA